MSNALEKADASALLDDLPDEAVGEALNTVVDTFSRVMETREISRARQEEMERQLEALHTRNRANRAQIQQLADVLESNAELLTDEQRGELVSTICELALRDS